MSLFEMDNNVGKIYRKQKKNRKEREGYDYFREQREKKQQSIMPSIENVEEIDIFEGKQSRRDTTSKLELVLSMDIPDDSKDGYQTVDFELALPSVDEIKRLKRRKLSHHDRNMLSYQGTKNQ